MKKTVLILSLFVGIGSAYSQNVNIPDANFKAYLVGNTLINTNMDTEIQVSEASAFNGIINCSNLNISDLTGISAFTSLTSLNCSDNLLTSLNISSNSALTALHCYNNSIGNIDFSNNTSLTDLRCFGNQLTSLDVSGNPALTFLSCTQNLFSSINVKNGNNTAITQFYAGGNPNLTCIQVDDAVYSTTNWINIDAAASFSELCAELCTVNIPDANFKAYLVGNSSINTNGDTEIQCAEATAFTGSINCNSLGIVDFTGLEAFINLNSLTIAYNPVTTLDISQNTALTILHVYLNALTSLDVSNNTALVELRFERNPIMNIDISNLTNLELLTCGNSGLTSLDVTNNPNLGVLDIGGNPASGNVNQITSLNLANNTQLYYLGTWATPIASLDLTNNVGLEILQCSSNNLTVLDVSMLPSLENLSCSSNSITSLDVSNNLALTTLSFGMNPIVGSFDLSNHASLTSFSCFDTQISGLNIANGNNSNFTAMQAYENPNLTCVQVDDAVWSTANWNAWDNIDATTTYSLDCNSCIVNIPDANFKAYLVGNAAINTNGDTEIQCSEASVYSSQIFVQALGIQDLTGLEAFTSLVSLNCNSNLLTSIDVSANTALFSLNFAANQISAIDVSNNLQLSDLFCDYNQLTTIDVSSNINLTKLNFNNNNVSQVDISANSNLIELGCESNTLTDLNAANGNNINFTAFYATGNPNLTCIEVDDATYSTTNWTNIDATASFSENCAGGVGIEEFNTISMTIYPNPVSSILNIETEAAIESIHIFNVNGALVQSETTKKFSVESLMSGVYLISVKTTDGVITKRFVKE